MTKDPFEPFAVDVLNSLAAHIAVLDAQGVVVAVNEAWRQFARENGSLDDDGYVGTNYLATCEAALQHSGDDTAEVALQGIQAVLGGHLASASLEYPCHAPSERRWFVVHITRFMHAGINWLLVVHENITAGKRTEQTLKDTERILRSLIDELPIGVWILNEQGEVLYDGVARSRLPGAERGRSQPLESCRGLGASQEPTAADEPTAKSETNGQEAVGHSFYDLAVGEFSTAQRDHQPLAVVLFDIDRFRGANNRFGIEGGDAILAHVTQIAEKCLREADLLGHYGDDEFIVLLPRSNAQQAFVVAERVREGVAARGIDTELGRAHVTISVGISDMVPGTDTLGQLIRRADRALCFAKEAGRNRTRVFLSPPALR